MAFCISSSVYETFITADSLILKVTQLLIIFIWNMLSPMLMGKISQDLPTFF